MAVFSKRLTLLCREVFEIFVKPGEVVEVRILGLYGHFNNAWEGYSKGTVSGYFDDHSAFCEAVRRTDKQSHAGIYFTLQVIDKRLIGRALNRLKAVSLTTSDNNVIAYRWLPIDIDPIRPAGIGSSDKELHAAIQLRDKLAGVLVSEYKLPDPIRAISGNGGHLLVRLPDLPINDKSQLFIKSTLDGLSKRYSNDKIKIDTSVFNPSRIWKLYGTTARKGDAVPSGTHREARPYRMSYIDRIGTI